MSDAVWQKSSYSVQGNCVEIARLAGSYTALRNSRDPEGPVLVFTEAEWNAFLRGLAVGEFD